MHLCKFFGLLDNKLVKLAINSIFPILFCDFYEFDPAFLFKSKAFYFV